MKNIARMKTPLRQKVAAEVKTITPRTRSMDSQNMMVSFEYR